MEIVLPIGLGAVAVWFQTSLETCLARNAQRPADELVAERAICNVFAALEPPSIEEGFEAVLVVP
jgi:predicted kinase